MNSGTKEVTEKPLNNKEIEAVRNAIGGMSEQEMILVAETLPIGILINRIQSDFSVIKNKLDRIEAIINE